MEELARENLRHEFFRPLRNGKNDHGATTPSRARSKTRMSNVQTRSKPRKLVSPSALAMARLEFALDHTGAECFGMRVVTRNGDIHTKYDYLSLWWWVRSVTTSPTCKTLTLDARRQNSI